MSIVRGLEKQVGVLYWRASVKQKYYGSDSVVTLESDFHVEAFFDPTRKFYNVSYVNSSPDTDSNNRPETKDQLGFDGNQYTFLAHNRLEGGITKNRMDFPSSHIYSGLVFSPEGLLPGLPNIFSPMATLNNDGRAVLLSSFLSGVKKMNRQFVINEEGVLNIVIDCSLEKTTDCPVSISLFYDTQKGGIITSAVVKYKQFDKNKVEQERELCNWTVVTKQNSKGKWVPIKTTYKEFFSSGSLSATLEATFDMVEINPPIETGQYVLTMPEGYFVEDFINKLQYRVGTPIKEDEAIENFMRRHGLTGNVPEQVRRDYTVIRYVLMSVGLAMVLFALFRMFQNWRKS